MHKRSVKRRGMIGNETHLVSTLISLDMGRDDRTNSFW